MGEYEKKQRIQSKVPLQEKSNNSLYFIDNRISNLRQCKLLDTITTCCPQMTSQLKYNNVIQKRPLFRAGNTRPRVEYDNIGALPLIKGTATNKDITAQVIVNGTEGLSTYDSVTNLTNAGLRGTIKQADVNSGAIYDVIPDGGVGTKPLGHVTIAPHLTQNLSTWTNELNSIPWT